ncbi:MAG: protein kinase [Myxococcota bacterium]
MPRPDTNSRVVTPRGDEPGGSIRQIALGPFVLETRIGRGGMGEVWRARHQAEGVRVAVKLLTAKGASETMFVESFRNEVRAVAPLEHPHIAMVLDYGSVPDQAAKASKGRLVAGTPFLSMELLEGTTLADHMGTLDWPEINRLLLCLLDALAHAHARSVIHRDLKLSNVLYESDSGRVKLTDFGIAHAMAATGDPFRWGTPAYMPPEQLLGRWWDYGPWTDLYSLGCCAYTLITGHRAFPDELSGNLKDRILPPLRPRMTVPQGIEDWLNTLTAPRPDARFQLAADAAYALHRISKESKPAATRISVVSKKPVAPRAETTIALALSELDGSDPSLAEETLVSYLPSDTRVPPMPSRWRPPRDAERSTMLLGAGLGLYGLRRIPMVGREEERTALWRELSAVRASGKARLVLLHGPAGAGKTRIGEWLCERANEVGAALVMRASHGVDSTGSGLIDMIGRYLRTGGLSAKQLTDRVQRAWAGGRPEPDPQEIEHMVTLLSGRSDPKGATTAPATLVRRFVLNQARHRPLIIFLDDVQWGADALSMAHQVLSAQALEPAPVLVVMCTREEALAERPTERGLMDELVDQHGRRIRVERLSPREHHALIQELIGLEGVLARRVEERTAGNPLFAVQLIGDWVQRGILRPGRRGFQLRDTAELALPDDLYAVWAGRIDDVLKGRPDTDRYALEIAAVLGQRVLADEWLGACRARGLTPSPDLVDTLLSRHLASLEEGRGAWSFAHSMLRESLGRTASEAGRAKSHHRACAAMLQASGKSGGERLARHLVQSGTFEPALEPTVRAIRGALQAGDYNRADALRSLWEEAMVGLELHEGDPRWVPGLVAIADVQRFKDRPKQVTHICHRLETGAQRHSWPAWLRSFVRLHQGRIAETNGHFQDAVSLFRDGLRLLAEPGMAASLHAHLGRSLVLLGAFAGAEAEFREAQRLAERQRNRIDLGEAWIGIGEIALFQGDLDRARRATARARDAFRQTGHRWGLAQATERFGDIARHNRSWDEALHFYRTAASIWHALGTESAALTSDVHIALIEVERGGTVGVAGGLDQLSARARGFGHRALWATVRLAQVVVDAKIGRTKSWDHHLAEANKALAETQYVSPDIASTAELAGREAKGRGWKDRAREAFDLSLQQWMRLGREDDADRVRWALP